MREKYWIFMTISSHPKILQAIQECEALEDLRGLNSSDKSEDIGFVENMRGYEKMGGF